MTELRSLSDADLLALHAKAGGAGGMAANGNIQGLSDEDLIAAYRQIPKGSERTAKIDFEGRFNPPAEGDVNPVVDAARSLSTGIVRGSAAVLGLPGDLQSGMNRFGEWVGDRIFGDDPQRKAAVRAALPTAQYLPTTADIRQAGTDVTGISLSDPTTGAGRYAETVGEFIPSVIGGRTIASLGQRAAPAIGKTLGDLAKYAVAPGIASEGAGQAFEGTAAEPWARVAAGVATGGLAALASRPGSATAALRQTIPKTATTADVTAARSLMAEAEGRGVSLTWPEALAQVTGRRVDMTDMQRVIEQSPGGRPVMAEFNSRRPVQTEAAMDSELQRMGRQASPVQTGLDIQRVSTAALTALRQRINAITEPLYRAAGRQSIDPRRFQALTNDPLFSAAVKDVRNDPVFSRSVAGQPDASVAMFDAVKKRLDDLAGQASQSGQNYAASTYGGVARDVRSAAQDASPDYAQALQRQTDLRRGVLDPAEAGPLGRMSETPDVRRQITSLLPDNPTAGSERVVAQTVRRIARRDPNAAMQLVRTHLTTAFDEAAQATSAGANQWGAANAAGRIMGNRQQEKNLQAAIEALPAGQLRWQGLKKLMEVFQATGMRQRPGSATEFNRQISGDLSRGGVAGTGASLAMSPSRAISFVSDFYQRFRLGQNTESLARIITTPGNENLFARLVGSKSLTERQVTAAMIVYQAQDQLKHDRTPAQ